MRAALRLPAFPRLLGAYAVSQLGDWAAEVALAVLVYALTESPLAVAVTWFVHRCLLGLAAPLLVARLERHRPQRLLPALALGQATIFAALALSAGRAGLAGILALVAADGLIAPVSRALLRSTIAAVTRPAGLLAEGNAAVNVAFTTNAMLAAAVGGVLTATLGAPAALAFNALTFLAVAALLGSAPLHHRAGGDEHRDDQATAVAALQAALAHVRDQRPLALMLGAYAAFTVCAMAITPVEVVLVRGTLHAGSAALGVVLGAWGVGMIAGGALVGRIRRRVGLAALLIGAAVAEAIAFLGMGLSVSVIEVAAFAALGGAGNGLEGVLFMTAVQERVSDAYQARVSGLMEALMTAAVGIGFLAGGTVAALAGARATYLAAGLGSLAVVAWTLTRLRAPARHGPALDALANRLRQARGVPLGVVQAAASISQKERMPSRS
jgi:predicted MFS family arabinose efflux permease